MPKIYFILFEIFIYIQFALCLRHAVKNGKANLLKLFVGVAYGVLLEIITIQQLNAYHYARFLIMVGNVPLCIGMAWSAIIYSVMEFSDATDLPYYTRPVLDGLLALNIDLALDAIAIRLGFWDWGQGLNFQYFGVPYANFWAWFWVVTFFSFGYRLLALRTDWVGRWVPAFFGLVIGLIGLLGTNALITFVIPFDYHALTVAPVLLGATFVIFASRPRFNQQAVDPLVFWVPFLTHGYLLIAGIISGVIFNPPTLLWISLIMIIIAFILHKPTIKQLFVHKSFADK